MANRKYTDSTLVTRTTKPNRLRAQNNMRSVSEMERRLVGGKATIGQLVNGLNHVNNGDRHSEMNQEETDYNMVVYTIDGLGLFAVV